MLFLTCLYRTPPKSLYSSFLLNMFSISYPLPLRFTLWEWCVGSMPRWRGHRLARSAAHSLCGWASTLTSHRLRSLNHEVQVRVVLTLQYSFTGISAAVQTPGGTVTFLPSSLYFGKDEQAMVFQKSQLPQLRTISPVSITQSNMKNSKLLGKMEKEIY